MLFPRLPSKIISVRRLICAQIVGRQDACFPKPNPSGNRSAPRLRVVSTPAIQNRISSAIDLRPDCKSLGRLPSKSKSVRQQICTQIACCCHACHPKSYQFGDRPVPRLWVVRALAFQKQVRPATDLHPYCVLFPRLPFEMISVRRLICAQIVSR